MRISDWSSDVCSSDLSGHTCAVLEQLLEEAAGATEVLDAVIAQSESQAGSLWRLRENISEGQKRSGVSIKHDISVPISKIDSFLARAGSALTKSYPGRSEEHTSELQSLMRISYAVFCLKKKKTIKHSN